MKKRLSRIVALVMSLALVLGLGTTSLAAQNDATGPLGLTITAAGGTFTYDSVSVTNHDTNETYNAYAAFGEFDEGSNLSSVNLTFHTTATKLTVAGKEIELTEGTGTETVNLSNDSILVTVADGTKTYECNVAGYIKGSKIAVNATVDYQNAINFVNTPVGTVYGDSEMQDEITQEQHDKAVTAVAEIQKVLPEAKTTEAVSVDGGSNAKDVLNVFKGADGQDLTVVGTASYVNSINGLGEDSTGMLADIETGGWMFSVIRNGKEVWPNVAASLWQLQPGDTVIWHYTCDWGADLGVNIWDM